MLDGPSMLSPKDTWTPNCPQGQPEPKPIQKVSSQGFSDPCVLHYCSPYPCSRGSSGTHRVTRRAVAAPGGPIAGAPIEAEAELQASSPKGARGAALVAEEPSPARATRAFTEQRVAAGGTHSVPRAPSPGAANDAGDKGRVHRLPLAVLGVTEAVALAVDAIETRKAAGLLAAAALKAGLAQARAVHMEALSSIGTVTALLAVLPIPPHRAPLPAPVWRHGW